MLTRPVWVPDAMSKECMICSSKFTPFVRKHHCRRCGRVICTSCSPHRVSLNTTDGPGGGLGTTVSGEAQQGKLERTCRECFKEMTAVHNRGTVYTKYRYPTVNVIIGLFFKAGKCFYYRHLLVCILSMFMHTPAFVPLYTHAYHPADTI